MFAPDSTHSLGLHPRLRNRPELPWIPSAATRAVVQGTLRSGTARTGISILALFTLAAMFAPLLTTHDPSELVPARRLLAPSSTHWLGTDDLGRDVFARLMYGARNSLVIAGAVSALSVLFGTIVGLATTTHRALDATLMRATDGMMAFPSILIGIVIVVRLGPETRNVVLALTLAYTPVVARLVRTTAVVVRAWPHVEAARAVGASEVRILSRHVLPNALSPLLAHWSFIGGLAALSEASLSFLGTGVGSEGATWGALLRDGQNFIASAWWIAVPAGLALTATVLACTLVGDGLRDALDPRTRRSRTPSKGRQDHTSPRSAGRTSLPSTSIAWGGSGPRGGPKDTCCAP